MLEDLILDEDVNENEIAYVNQFIQIIKDNQYPLEVEDGFD